MKKQILALLSAMLITGLMAMTMVVIGVNAMTNRNGTVVSNSPSAASASGSASSPSDQALIAQLQAQVAQYQARDQQYQAALNSDNAQLAQAANEMQTIQQLLNYLQERGLIQINSQGQIFVPDR